MVGVPLTTLCDWSVFLGTAPDFDPRPHTLTQEQGHPQCLSIAAVSSYGLVPQCFVTGHQILIANGNGKRCHDACTQRRFSSRCTKLRSMLRGCTERPKCCSTSLATSWPCSAGCAAQVCSTKSITSAVSLCARCGPGFCGNNPVKPLSWKAVCA